MIQSVDTHMETQGFKEWFSALDEPGHFYSDVEVVNLYQQNRQMKVSELAKMTGRSLPEFYRVLHRYNVSPSRLKTNQHLVLSYHDQGYSLAEIAQLTGYTTRNIRYILKANNLQD